MADWAMISALTTGGGTLVLAVATFASVRTANRASRVAERSLLAGLRPLLMPSKPDDPTLKVGFIDNHFVAVPGGSATVEVTESVVYLSMSVPFGKARTVTRQSPISPRCGHESTHANASCWTSSTAITKVASES